MLNPLSLPTNPDREAVFARAHGSRPYFDKRLKLWIVLDPDAVTELLQDERLVVPEITDALSALERRYDVCLPNLKWIASELPLLANGDHHRRVRQSMAKAISTGKKRFGDLSTLVTHTVADLMNAPGEIDAFRQLLLPIVDTMFATITMVDVSFPPLTLTRIFDHYTGYQKLIDLELVIASLRERLRAGGATSTTEGTLAAVVVLGHDSLLASLSESLVDLVTSRVARRLDDPAARPPRLLGGVGIAERLAREPVAFGPIQFNAGDRLRFYFQGHNYIDSEIAGLGVFGAGAHSCLGRPLALDVWSTLAAEIVKVPQRVEAVYCEYERSVIFAMPKFIKLKLV